MALPLVINKDSKKNSNKSSLKTSSSSKNIISDEIKKLLDQLPHHTLIINDHNTYANLSLRHLIHLKKHNYTIQDLLTAFHPDDATVFSKLWENTQNTGEPIKKSFRIKNYNSNQYEWFLVLSKGSTKSNHQTECSITLTSIHEQIKIPQTKYTLNTQTEILDASVDCIKIVNTNGYVSHINKSGCKALLGKEKINTIEMKWIDLLPPEIRDKGQIAINKANQGQIARFSGMSGFGHSRQYWDNILTPISNDKGFVSNILCISRDITAQKKAEDLLRISNEHDDLTGLLNRRGLKKNIKSIFKKALAQGHKVGLLLVDLDHFKHVNDTLGHSAGDYFLKTLTKRLIKTIGYRATIARLGGDEFAIVINHLEENQLLKIGKQIIQQLEIPISYKGKILTGGMSIGCAIFPDDSSSFSGLLQCADTALTDLKMRGRGGIRCFGKDMLSVVKSKAQQIETARFIIRERLIKPFYQPKFKLETNELAGVEALLRWYDQDGEIHMPDSVHEAFSDFELSSKISEIMQLKIFDDIKRWQNEGKQVVPVAINASPVEFLRDNYAETLLKRLHTAKISPEHIEIEITEHLFTDRGVTYVVRALKKLRAAGVKIALDDFGTGHSSLSHLRDLPVDAIKIDYSFVELMTEDYSIRAIVEGIIKLGPLLSLKIIAEGIENTEQLKLLKEMGCHEGQGFLFNKAMNRLDIKDMLKNS